MSNNIPVNGWPQLKDLEAVQPTLDRLDKIEAWKRTVKEETFTGAEITIPNALALPARSLITSINVIQDLHGLPFPYVGGAYKNKLHITATTQTKNGYTFTFADDGTFSISGTPTSTVTEIVLATQTIPSGDYKLNGCGFANDNCRLQLFKGSTLVGSQYNNNDLSFTSDGGEYKLTIVVINAAGTLNNQIVKPMIRLSTESDASFAPYSNICPISGRTEARVDDTGRNIWGGDRLADDIVAKVTGGIKDTTNHTVSYTASAINNIELFTGFEPNKQYTFFFDSSSSFLNLGIKYTDGTQAEILSNRVVSDASKSVKAIVGVWHSGTIVLNYLNCGCFIGNVATFEPYRHSSATIQLGTTVYGAYINWDTGVASVLNAMIALNSKSWGGSNGNFYTSNPVADIKCNDGRYDHCISDRFMPENQPTLARLSDGGMSVDNSGYIQIKCSAYSTSSDFVTAMGDAQLCYELATPTTIQLTPTMLEMLKGYNHITLSDGYGTIELKALTGANWS